MFSQREENTSFEVTSCCWCISFQFDVRSPSGRVYIAKLCMHYMYYIPCAFASIVPTRCEFCSPLESFDFYRKDYGSPFLQLTWPCTTDNNQFCSPFESIWITYDPCLSSVRPSNQTGLQRESRLWWTLDRMIYIHPNPHM